MKSRRPTAPDEEEETASWPILQPLEGVHFYWDGEYLVFTEAYHLARGICCGSGCRHCPYDHVTGASDSG